MAGTGHNSPDGKTTGSTPFRVLIVDDSPYMIKQMSHFLQSLNCTVAGTAGEGAKAVSLYEKLKPDLVTLDITMPGMDGIQALSRIMELDPQAKVVMVSALGHENMVKEAMLKGASYFIVKPLTLDKITQTLAPVLEKIRNLKNA